MAPVVGGDRNMSDDRPETSESDPETSPGVPTEDQAQPPEGGDLSPREIDRMFDLLEQSVEAESLTIQERDRLLSILENAADSTAGADPETFGELLSILEEFILDPDALGQIDLDHFLGIFEEAISGATLANDEALTDAFDVIETGLRDPTSVQPKDMERFQTSIQRAFTGTTGGTEGLGGLLDLPFADMESDPQDATETFRIARLATAMTQRVSGYSIDSGLRTGTRMAYAAANAGSPAELLTSARAIALDELRRAGIDIGEEQEAWLSAHEAEAVNPRPLTRDSLQERGARLISQSEEVGRDESLHPSYSTLLDQLSTDEARILRLLATDGAQAVIDVYDKQYLPPKMRPVARNLTMLGRDAGCRIPDRVPMYVQNLTRLGIARISEEPIDDLERYEILEAQSHVDLALSRARRPRTDYKRIELSDFGAEFCRICFPFESMVEPAGIALRRDVGN